METLKAIGIDEFMEDKEELLLLAGSDVHWQESSTETDRSRMSSGREDRVSSGGGWPGREYA